MKDSKLKQRRINKGVNIDFVSKLIGVKKERLYRIEEGYLILTLQIAVKLSKIYGCSVEDLCNDIGLDIKV